MKKLSLIFACAALLFASTALRADNVDESQARNVAATYMASLRGQKVVDFSTAKLFKTYINPATGDNSLYIYNIADNGYVVIAGNTASTPVLAYNEEGVLTASDFVENRAFADWIQHYADMIALAQVKELPYSRKDVSDWASLSEGQPLKKLASKGSNTKLLMTTWWQQSAPYNDKCPYYSGQARSVVGCVALSLGMVLRYWEYPVHPVGRTYTVNVSSQNYFVDFDEENVIYDYSLMPNKLTEGSANYAAEKEAVTTFLYHCGPAVNMSYTSTGSGTNMGAVTVALRDNYKYSGFNFIERNNYSGDWVELMKNEILSGRPVIYRAQDNGSDKTHSGHAFNIVGYRESDGKFRVNFGWGVNAAPWCDLNEIDGLKITLGEDYYEYSSNQGAFVNVMPPADSIHIELPEPPVTSINKVEDIASISAIYPQPASQQVNIPYALTGSSDEQMEIYNVEGKLMTSLRVSAANNKATVSVKGFPAGIYTCRLKGASRKFIVK
ncbi:MAG: thiol protease/hemagglutinin PrtT [Bacteroidales bacterium]|nr:thiol protease/hemagglutinin PrtT [Bacteroidales bacterium]